MNPTTKYALNDTLWFMSGNRVCSRQVSRIVVDMQVMPGSEPQQRTLYYLGSFECGEMDLFRSREELLASL